MTITDGGARTVAATAAATALLLALAGCDGSSASISDKDIGPRWPFTVSQVKLVCAPSLAMFVTANGKAYPLNGQAERHPELYKKGKLSPLNEIWKIDPIVSRLSPDSRMTMDAFTDKAIAACTKAGKWEPAKA